jgi:hypothetical protein
MRTHTRNWAAAAALALAFGFLGGAGDAQDNKATFKKFLPPEAYKELVTRTAKAIEANLAAPEDEDNLRRAQAQAIYIVAYAMSAKADVGNTPGVQGAAGQLARIGTDKSKLPQAKQLAADLATLHGQAQANDAVLGKYSDLAELMNLLKPKGKGGEGLAPALQSNIRLKGALNGIEEKIRALAKKQLARDRIGTEAEALALLGYKLAVLGELTVLYQQGARKGKGTTNDWNRLCLAMRDESLDLAAAAAKKDAKATFEAATKLDSTCTECHNQFR